MEEGDRLVCVSCGDIKFEMEVIRLAAFGVRARVFGWEIVVGLICWDGEWEGRFRGLLVLRTVSR